MCLLKQNAFVNQNIESNNHYEDIQKKRISLLFHQICHNFTCFFSQYVLDEYEKYIKINGHVM